MNREFQGYDIIGDVHGCYDALVQLLALLGYREQSGTYRHPARQAVFLGDLVDRGPKIRETLHLVQSMVAQDSARVVLGNHEINLIGFHTEAGPESERRYVREQTDRHRTQLAETLGQFQAYPGELKAFIDWLYSLPLFIEFDHFRVAHACWDQSLIEQFQESYATNRLSKMLLQNTVDYGSLEFKLVNRMTRGTSMRLPDGQVIRGRDGFERRFFRTKFWLKDARTYGDLVFQPDGLPQHLHDRQLTPAERAAQLSYGATEKPLFVGHYWRSGRPALETRNIACLDYSAVHGGKLVAYRLDRPGPLNPENLVWVDVQ